MKSRRKMVEMEDGSEPFEIPIDGILDLHAFDPNDVKPLIRDYLDLCREKGIFHVRIIHGKGTGVLRETVRAELARNPAVERFHQAEESEGGWGATIVHLRPLTKADPCCGG